MKLYRVYITFIFIVLFAGIFACSNEGSEIIPEITVSLENLTVSNVENTKTFYVESNVDWSIETSETWCRVSPTSGSAGYFPIVISLDENPLFEERITSLLISGGEIEKSVSIQQEKAYALSVESNEINISEEGGEININLSLSESFEVSVNCDWITKKSLKSLQDSTEVYVVEANTTYIPREGEITYVLNDITEVVTVTQEGINPSIPQDISGVESNAETLAAKMKVGWNIGNSLEVPGGETGWGNPIVSKTLIDAVKDAGFNSIRIPCAWDSYIVTEENYEVSEAWFERVKEVVDYCIDNDMYAILNIHWDGGWLENNPTYEKQDEVNREQYSLWIQIATYFRDYDEHLLFAGTNEVHVDYGIPSTENIEVQQSFNQTFVDAVRATGGKNTYRNLIIQTYNTDIDFGLEYHKMPEDVIDDRLMLEVHYYSPWEFCGKTDDGYNTQWGAGYTDVTSYGQEDYLSDKFSKVKEKYVDNGIPVILGEYGAILRTTLTGDAYTKHVESRNYYLKTVTAKAIENGLVPFIWDNGATGNNGFGLFNRSTGAQVHSGSITAIIEGAN